MQHTMSVNLASCTHTGSPRHEEISFLPIRSVQSCCEETLAVHPSATPRVSPRREEEALFRYPQSTGKGAKKCVPISLSQSILSFSNVEEVMEYYASMEEEQEVRQEVSIGESMEEFEGAESNEESEMEDREQKRLEVKGNAGEMDMEHHDHSGGTEGGHQTHSFDDN